MAFKRTAIPFFELANSAYASSTIAFFAVDAVTFERETTLITIYAAKTGTTTLSNPLTLDSSGKFSVPAYAEERFIAVVTDVDGQQHETGIWEPALSDADVAAAAASAASAASSSSDAQSAEQGAEDAQTAAEAAATAAAASAALAAATVGKFRISGADTTADYALAKLLGTAAGGIRWTNGNAGGNETYTADFYIPDLTPLAGTVSPANDYAVIYSASEGGLRKVAVQNIADEQSLVLASQVYGRRW